MRKRVPLARHLWVVPSLLFAMGLTSEWSAAGETPNILLTAFDEVAHPGEAVTLRAKLERLGWWGLHFHMHGNALTFSSPGLVNREVKTAEEGMATVAVRMPEGSAGLYRVRVGFAGSGQHQSAEAVGHIFVWPKDSPVLVTDIDHTISDLSILQVPFTPNRETPALAGAVEALTELARTYRIVYLTARDEILLERTRAWLSEKGFPEGPLFCRDFHLGGRQETFKRQFLAELKGRYPYLVVGVGDQPSDARAYLSNGLKAFLLNPDDMCQVPRQAIVVRSWREVRDGLLGEPEKFPKGIQPVTYTPGRR
jgi:hypothetical protein